MLNAPELSHPLKLDMLGGEPKPLAIEADADERAALAARFGLVAIEQLAAEATVTREGDRIACEGRLRARVTQACVASGEPVPAIVDEPFHIRFRPAAEQGTEDEIELDADELDTIDYAGGAIDVGEAVAQTLALALDPFPRAPGADTALREAGVLGEGELGPFAALKALKDRL